MKKVLLTLGTIFTVSISYAQNVGVDVASPVEKLDVLGAIRIGNTSNTNAGAIRWNSPNFQGYDGTQWVNFGGGILTGSGTATRVAFWSGTSALSSSANLYWDNTNSRLAVGLTNPLGKISAGPSFGDKIMAYDDGTFAVGLGIQPGFLQMYVGNNANNIVFGYGNSASFTENVRFTGAGNVGIGTSAPSELLDVNGKIRMRTGATTGYVPVSDANGTMTWTNPTSLTITETDPQVSSTTTNYIPKWNGTALVDGVGYDNGTNIGIGTTAPDYKLHVSGSDYLTLKLVAPNYPLLKLSGSYNSGNGAEFWQDNTGDARLNINGSLNAIYMKSSGDVGIGMAFPTTPAARLDVNNGTATVPIFVARDNGSEVLRIADGGNLGIGSTNPSQKLDVAGTTRTTNFQMTGGTPATNQVLTSIDNAGNASWEPVPGDNLGDHTATSNIELNNNWLSNDGGNEGIRVDNSGNVGIGLVPGSVYLDITGTNAGTTSLQLRSGNIQNANTSNQIVMSYDNTENFRHAIKTRHSSGGPGGNAIDFYVWKHGTDPNGTIGTQHVLTIDGGNAGSVGIGTTGPGAQLHTTGSVRFAGLSGASQTTAVMADGSGNLSTRSLNAVAFTGDLPSGDTDYIQNSTVGNDFATGQNASFDIQSNAEIGGSLTVGANIGIGTASPGSPLEIVKNGGNTALFRNTSTTHYSGIRFYNDQNSNVRSLEIDYSGSAYPLSLMAGGVTGEAGSIATTGNYPLMIGTLNTLRMIVEGGGNVGIGTNAPKATLSVAGDGVHITGNGLTPSAGSGIELSGGAVPYLQSYNRTTPGYLPLRNIASYFTFEPNGSLGVRINSSGLGIGIIPSFNLHSVTPNTAGLQNFITNSGASFGGTVLKINATTPISTAWLLAVGSGSANDNTGTFSSKLVVQGDGNVGIGQSSPSATLDVVGTVEMFGAWTGRSANTVYQAATDGFIIAWAAGAYFKVITDGSSTPTTVRMEAEGNVGNASRPNAMCPVRKGDYWKVEGTSGGTPTVWWMPLGQ